jgi:hypothetical protein
LRRRSSEADAKGLGTQTECEDLANTIMYILLTCIIDVENHHHSRLFILICAASQKSILKLNSPVEAVFQRSLSLSRCKSACEQSNYYYFRTPQSFVTTIDLCKAMTNFGYDSYLLVMFGSKLPQNPSSSHSSSLQLRIFEQRTTHSFSSEKMQRSMEASMLYRPSSLSPDHPLHCYVWVSLGSCILHSNGLD